MFHILDETNAHLVWKKKTPQKPTHTNLKNQAKSIKIMQWCRKQIDSVCGGRGGGRLIRKFDKQKKCL